MTAAPAKTVTRDWLATPLTPDERQYVDYMYRKHGGLVKDFGRKFRRKYPAVNTEDIYSIINLAFIKTCRKWDATKGTFSNLLGVFCEGDIRHFIRDRNWHIKAPGSIRARGLRANYMVRDGKSREQVCEELGITAEQLREALFAVQGMDHEIKDFAFHYCPRPTPWEVLEQDPLWDCGEPAALPDCTAAEPQDSATAVPQ